MVEHPPGSTTYESGVNSAAPRFSLKNNSLEIHRLAIGSSHSLPEASTNRHCSANFRHSSANFSDLPPRFASYTSRELLQKYLNTRSHIEEAEALNLLKSVNKAFQVADLDFSADNSILKNFAVEKANQCKDLLSSNQFDEATELFGFYNLGPLHYSEAEIKNRLTDSRFWLRRIRRQQSAIICQIERSLGYVSKRKAVYCGDVSLNNRRVQQAKSQQFMESTLLQNDKGLTVSLAEIASHTISNPVIRRHELMVRIRGFEEVAQLCGHSAVFVTITTPSRMHVTKASGKANPAFDGSTIQEAQSYLNHLWQMCRAKLDRDQLKPYGFRVVEPHHDGTPHWHLLLFMPSEQLTPFKKAINRYALLDSPDEKGAEQHRVKFIDIDPAKGSAAGYIAKYIAKNIDGFAVGTDTSGNKSTEMAERINAWAKASQIRQFQQIGGPSVTVWRELRRIKQCNTPFFDLNEAHAAADSSNWAAFCLAMNSVGTIKKEHLLSPYYDIKPSEQVDFQTGEIIRLQLNQYQEQRKAVLLGLRYGATRLKTRTTTWRRQTAPPSDGVPPIWGGIPEGGGNLDLCK